ncbi:MAG: hypothetical protein K8823_1264 [Cenarchaeum symbiont of Oopsacas minuta]|nr:hypothetical protein [Cenarchaeum symbiont of Oopsacas minuta]
MNLAGIEISYLLRNLATKSTGYYLSNIYGITRDCLLFKLRHPEKEEISLMFSTFGLWISSSKIDPIEENKLQRRFRTDLLRLKLVNVKQLGAERIAYLMFEGGDKKFVLVGEFFDGGNIILCNEEMKILALLHSLDVRHRKLKVGTTYIPPPSRGMDVFKVSADELGVTMPTGLPADKWLGRTLGLPSRYVEEIFKKLHIDSKSSCSDLSNDDLALITNSVKEIVTSVVEGRHDAVIVGKGSDRYVHPIRMHTEENVSKVASFEAGLDKLFTFRIIEYGKESTSEETDKQISELENTIERQKKAVETVKNKSKAISSLALSLQNLTTQGNNSIDDIAVQSILTKADAKRISEKGVHMIQVCGEKIVINSQTSLHTIASCLYDESKRQIKAIPTIESAAIKAQKKIDALKDKSSSQKESISYSHIRKKSWYERYRWFYTIDGILAIGGRDSSSNTAMIRKHVEKDDLVFHADIHGSPFFILKNAQNATKASMTEVAYATVCFSRAWRETMFGLNAYWVKPEQVEKSAPSGQYLPRGAFVIRGTRNVIPVPTLRLGIGVTKDNDAHVLICGPVEPIKKACLIYAIIEPLGAKSTDTAKKIRSEFLKLDDSITKSIGVDEFVRVLPPSMCHMVTVGKNKTYST